MDIAHDEFTSYENIIVREYKISVDDKYAAVEIPPQFPASLLAGLWGAQTPERFAAQ